MSTPSVEGYLDQLVRLAADRSPALAGCGVTVRRGGDALSIATSSTLAASVDEVQYGLGIGPCLQTLSTGEVVHMADALDEERWDGYPAHALGRGVRSSLSVPLTVSGTTVGALNCYATETGVFTADLRSALADFAVHAEVALALSLRTAQQADVVAQLHAAMQSRSTIDQALGILMARQRCTAEEAFAVLRSASQSRNRRLVDIAADVIVQTTGHPPQPGRFET